MRLLVRRVVPAVVLPLLLTGAFFASPQLKSNRTASVPTASGQAVPMPPDRADDSYAIYSQLMPGDAFARMAPELNAHWAIAEITVNEDDRNPAVAPQTQLKPPPENPRGFQEAVQDYEANKQFRIQLTKPPFHIDHDFSLLSPQQVAALRAARSGSQASSQAQWAGYPGITFFSEVYFDTKHRAALVYMNDWCAQLCASGTWVYLEKHTGQWVRRSGVVVPGV
ncbi:MAG: hypothetical protein WB622_08285 [Acidobacteriaceae bacterium]